MRSDFKEYREEGGKKGVGTSSGKSARMNLEAESISSRTERTGQSHT